MLNILLVFTGGTIGSTTLNGTINTSKKQGYKLLDLFQQSYPEKNGIHFKTIQPVDILSENLHPTVWKTLIIAIENENISQYDGVIITHGTDTLAFTAAALSLYFNEIKIPLLLVSSDYPLDHPQANGLIHFICATEFIKQRKEAGVFVPYKNQKSAVFVHLGTRIASCLQLSGDFISVQSKAYLSFERNTFYPNNPINSIEKVNVQLKPHFNTCILLIKPYPGLDYTHLKLDQVDVVLHDLYHSGTACSTEQWGKNSSLLMFIQACNKKKIKLYMAPAIKNKDVYDSTKLLLAQGAKMIWNMSLESAYVKLLLAYGNYTNQDSVDKFLECDIAFESIDNDYY
jgi:L-asparaginase